nr:hypothetical protein [uncultured Dethiosulfovibrio sp.]
MKDKSDDSRNFTVGDVLKAMSKPHYPEYILKSVEQVGNWMRECLVSSDRSEEDFRADYDKLYGQLEWMKDHVDFLGEDDEEKAGLASEAVVISLDVGIQEEAVRMAIDHAAIFNPGRCRRIWMISDSWVPGEVFRYGRHIKALEERGVSFRFILVTPGGWTEIPLFDDGRSRRNLGFNDYAKGLSSGDHDQDLNNRFD